MADAVSSQTLTDEGNQVVMLFQNTSDGTGESAVTKVDPALLQGAPAAVCITGIKAVAVGMSVKVLWDATGDTIALTVPDAATGGPLDMVFEPPLRNPCGTGATGKIQFTTVGHTSGDTYSIELSMQKCPLT